MKYSLGDFGMFPPQGPRQVHWVGALSFEDRCSQSLVELRRMGKTPSRCHVIEYKTDVRPKKLAADKLRSNRRTIARLLDTPPLFHAVQSYKYNSFAYWLDELLETNGPEWIAGSLVVFDISCLTKLHCVALFQWLHHIPTMFEILIAYSTPINYSAARAKAANRGQWKDILFAPLLFDPRSDLVDNVGILILGHEGDRLRLALDEVEIERGLVIEAEAEEMRVAVATEMQNSFIYEQIESQRSAELTLLTAPLTAMEMVQKRVGTFMNAARVLNRRVVIFPIGPKPLIAAVVAKAVASYPEGTWYAYPIPRMYSVGATRGSARTYWAPVNTRSRKRVDG